MIDQIYTILQRYMGEDLINILSWYAGDAEYVFGSGYNEEHIVYIYTLIMGLLTVSLIVLILYAIIQAFLLLWKGVKNFL